MSFSEGRKQHSFLYTACGSLRYTFLQPSFEDLVTSASDLVFIPAGTRHTSTYMDHQNTVEIAQFDLTTGELPDYLTTPLLIRINPIEKLFSSIHNDLNSGVGEQSVYFQYRIYELFWQISQNVRNIPVKFRKLQIVLQEMHLHYNENRKISYYADLCGMSEPGFRRLFGEYTSMSPVEYRNTLRLQEAKKMLQSGEFSIEEAALQAGFSNLSFFCRSYKHLFGNSPGKDI